MDQNEKKTIEQIEEERALKKQKKLNRKKTVVVATALVVFLSLFHILFGYDRVREDKQITVNAGISTFEIADVLKDEGVIKKKLKFLTKVVVSGNYGKLKFGEFQFKKGMSHKDVINTMVRDGAKRETITLTIPEGFSVANIIDRMESLGIGNREEIIKALSEDYDYKFLEYVPRVGQAYYLEGFLFPSTYEFYKDVAPQKVIDTLLGEFEKQYNLLGADYEDIYNIIIKASMVEREARIDQERATIAGVFENRLEKGMRLQIDATVAYVVSEGKYDVDRVTYRDLETDSPYNTYKIDTLPLGPIANPGIESIKAAINPENHTFLFYHTDEEKKDGSHIFTETFSQHTNTMS